MVRSSLASCLCCPPHALDAHTPLLHGPAGRAEKMQAAMACAWRFHQWSYPVGRAFDLVMCELKVGAWYKH